MVIQSAPSRVTAKPANDYTGPPDGQSHYDPTTAARVRGLTKAAMSLVERVEVRGEEKIPTSGSHLVAINHQTYFDAPTMAVASDKDIRFMAARNQFTGIVGQAMTAMGTFPVDQSKPMQALETGIELLNQDLRVGVYPQGRLQGETDEVKDFKEGTAMMALKSKCESLVPVAIDYSHPEPTVTARLGTYATAAAVTAAGLACATSGNPILQTLGGVLTGAVTGAVVAGGVGAATTEEKNVKTLALGFLKSSWKGALAGAVLGGLAGPASLWVAAPMSGVTGLAALGIGHQVMHRQKASVLVGDPIPVAPYRAMENSKEARAKLTADLEGAVRALKTELVKAREPL